MAWCPTGRRNRVVVQVAPPGAIVILKALATGQGDKDIDYLLAHVGLDEIATPIAGSEELRPVEKALAFRANKVGSVDVIGPSSECRPLRWPERSNSTLEPRCRHLRRAHVASSPRCGSHASSAGTRRIRLLSSWRWRPLC